MDSFISKIKFHSIMNKNHAHDRKAAIGNFK